MTLLFCSGRSKAQASATPIFDLKWLHHCYFQEACFHFSQIGPERNNWGRSRFTFGIAALLIQPTIKNVSRPVELKAPQ